MKRLTLHEREIPLALCCSQTSMWKCTGEKTCLRSQKTVIHSSAFANLNTCACDNYSGQMG